MPAQGLSRRHFFFGSLLAGAVPSLGFGSTPSLKSMGYKSPNEKVNLAGIGAGGQPFSDLKEAWAGVENMACKAGSPACSNFRTAGPYTEWLVLGAVATHYDGKLLWDSQKLEFTNNKDANKWIKPAFRKGWEIKL
jgi:hypothetical protein